MVALPFCTNCGTGVDPYASFCHNCGAPQPHPAAQFTDFLDGLSDRTASILCYIPVFGVIPAIVFLASQKYRANQRVRFNAFQILRIKLRFRGDEDGLAEPDTFKVVVPPKIPLGIPGELPWPAEGS